MLRFNYPKLLLNSFYLFFVLFFAYSLLAADTQLPNQKIDSFEEAKKYLEKVIYSTKDTRIDFYCGCPYDAKKFVEPQACGYKPKHDSKRSKKIEWEHIVPAENFGHAFSEWRDGSPDCVDNKGTQFKGRKCAEKTNPQFRHMEGDMYNLVPAVGELNQLRSNYQYGMVDGEPREFGACDFEIADKIAEPRPEIRGNIARTYFYMASAYPNIKIMSDKQRKLFQAWDAEDPVDKAECDRAMQIEKIQGNKNLILESACKKLNASKAEIDSEPDLMQQIRKRAIETREEILKREKEKEPKQQRKEEGMRI